MIKLVIIVLFFLLSLLTIFKAPQYHLWLAAVVVTGYPLLFAAFTFILVLSGIWIIPYRITGTVIGIAALLLFIVPVARAFFAAEIVNKEIKEAFKKSGVSQVAQPEASPFRFGSMFGSLKACLPQTHTYAKYGAISLSLDFYSSAEEGKKPCIIVVHGGSWSSGDRQQLPELNSLLSSRGYHVAAIDYRLAPVNKSPDPVNDIKNCLQYLRANSEKLNIDTTSFVLLGRSAGAQIALLAAYTLHDKSIIGVIDFYGPADMVWGYSLPSNPLIMNSRLVMENYLGGKYNEIPDKYRASSAIEFVDPMSPPTLIIHGKNDVLVAYEHSRRLHEKLAQNHVKHYWLKLSGETHGFDYNLKSPAGQLSTYAVEAFLKFITN